MRHGSGRRGRRGARRARDDGRSGNARPAAGAIEYLAVAKLRADSKSELAEGSVARAVRSDPWGGHPLRAGAVGIPGKILASASGYVRAGDFSRARSRRLRCLSIMDERARLECFGFD